MDWCQANIFIVVNWPLGLKYPFFFAGFGDSDHSFNECLPSSVNAVTPTSSLFDTAVAGECLHLTCHLFFSLLFVLMHYMFRVFVLCLSGKSKIAVDAVVKFVKQLFRYEQWSTFSSLSTALMSALAVSTSVIWLKMSARLLSSSIFLYCSQNMEGRMFRKYELELRILEAAERLMSTQRVKFITKDAAFDGQAGTNHII